MAPQPAGCSDTLQRASLISLREPLPIMPLTLYYRVSLSTKRMMFKTHNQVLMAGHQMYVASYIVCIGALRFMLCTLNIGPGLAFKLR